MVAQEQMRKKKYGRLMIQVMNGKKKNLKLLVERMKGWQLDTFKESYKNKIEEGISLYKKHNLKKDL